jgi:DNA-binding transcriptional LysR family regulator
MAFRKRNTMINNGKDNSENGIMYRHLNHLVTFAALAETGSFSNAARKLGLPPSTVTAHIASLEQNLGLQLVIRTTRQNRLTEQGRRLAVDAQRMVAVVEEAMARVESAKSEPTGQLRVAVPFTFAADLIGPVIGRFALRYPGIGVELVVSNAAADLIAESLDMAIRIGSLPDSGLIRRRIGSARIVVVASRSYLNEKGRPETVAALREHDRYFVGFRRTNRLVLRGPEGDVESEIEARIAANDPKTLAAIVKAGNGIAALPWFLVSHELASGELEIVLPQYVHESVEVAAVYHGQSVNNPRVELFTSFLISELAPMKEF